MRAIKINEYRAFLTFSLIGSAAFVLDASVLTGLLWLGLGPMSGRLMSFLTAVTFTWYFNRLFTFKNNDRRYFSQWCKFLSANAVGGLINLGVYGVAIQLSSYFAANPVLGVGLGSIAGLASNFYLSKRLVFSVR